MGAGLTGAEEEAGCCFAGLPTLLLSKTQHNCAHPRVQVEISATGTLHWHDPAAGLRQENGPSEITNAQ